MLHAPADVETMHPVDVLRWTFDNYGVENVVVTTSFEDAVLAHLAVICCLGENSSGIMAARSV